MSIPNLYSKILDTLIDRDPRDVLPPREQRIATVLPYLQEELDNTNEPNDSPLEI